MNVKDFRAAAYQKNIEFTKNEQSPDQKMTIPNTSTKTQPIPQKQKKQLQNQQLQKATDLLKSGGLIKVPVEKPESNGKD